jgi:hypothetical protein
VIRGTAEICSPFGTRMQAHGEFTSSGQLFGAVWRRQEPLRPVGAPTPPARPFFVGNTQFMPLKGILDFTEAGVGILASSTRREGRRLRTDAQQSV